MECNSKRQNFEYEKHLKKLRRYNKKYNKNKKMEYKKHKDIQLKISKCKTLPIEDDFQDDFQDDFSTDDYMMYCNFGHVHIYRLKYIWYSKNNELNLDDYILDKIPIECHDILFSEYPSENYNNMCDYLYPESTENLADDTTEKFFLYEIFDNNYVYRYPNFIPRKLN